MNSIWKWLVLACGALAFAAIIPACSSTGDDDPDDPMGPGGGDNDTTAPTVIEVWPPDESMEVITESMMNITFSEPMTQSDSAAEISMSHGSVTDAVWFSESDLGIMYQGWPQGTQVSVTVGTGFTDLAGNSLAQPLQLSYWTITDEFQVLEHTPATNAIDVNRGTSIEFLFSAMVVASTLETGVTISDDTKADIPFSVEEGEDGYRFRLRPDDPFAANSEITVTVGTGVQSGQGSLNEPYVFGFMTGELLDQDPPTIVSFDPPSGSTMPANQSEITIVFSEPINSIDFAPSALNGQLAWLLAQSVGEPQFNMDFTELTVPLPANLPAGLPLMAAFADYEDVNGNVQTLETVWNCTVAGSADPYPVSDGFRWVTEGTWKEGVIGNATPTAEGDEMVWYEFRARGTAGQWERAEFYDQWGTLDYYEILAVDASDVHIVGFAENEGAGFQEYFASSPILFLEFPFAAGNTWSGAASVTLPDGTIDIAGAGEVIGQEDLAFDHDGFEVVWTDVWRVVLDIDLSSGGSAVGADMTTFWFAPGVGVIREIYHEEDLEANEWFEYDRWLQIDLD